MPNHPEQRRRSIRLKNYDYSQGGGYFVTVCTQGRRNLFGEIENGEMILNPAGKMVQTVWEELPEHYPGVEVDAFVVMPNHMHGIIILNEIVGAGPRACPDANTAPPPHPTGRPQGAAPTKTLTLGDVVYRFKSLTSARYRERVANDNWPPFPGRLWQRNYYEHIIRTEKSFSKIREYIAANPQQWEFDWENRQAQSDLMKRNEIKKREKHFQEMLTAVEP